MSTVFQKELVEAVASDVERLVGRDAASTETIRWVARQIRGWAGGPVGLSDAECAPKKSVPSDDDWQMPF